MKFQIKPADTFIWNLSELVDFLVANQNRSIIVENGTEGCCSHTVGLYQWLDKFAFNKVVVRTSNLLEQHPVYRVEHHGVWKFLTVERPVDAQHHTWNQQAIFGTLYGRPLWHRLGIAAHLLYNHPDKSCVGFATSPTTDQRELYELNLLWQHSPDSVADFAAVYKQLPLIHTEIDQYTPGATLTDGFVAQSERVYKNFLIDIVAETFTSGNCFFVTEKTVRPMLLKKPMIAMAPRNYLLYLRQLGFRTFADFWSEDYDGYEGQQRYTKILELIDHLATKSNSELEAMYWDMQYTLDHNYQLLMDQSYNRSIQPI